MTARQVLFLCSGNYYRSRYAEILFNWQATARGISWQAFSRGLQLDDRNTGPLSSYTQQALNTRGIPLGPHLRGPQGVTNEDFECAAIVVAVKEAEHRHMIMQKFPEWLQRVEFWHVDDLDCSGPEVTFLHLDEEVSRLVQRVSVIP